MYLRTHGLGQATPGATQAAALTSSGITTAGGAVTGIVASQAATAAAATGDAASILGISASVAVPIIGAAIAGVAMAVAYFIKNSGCGITCVETSDWANQVEPYLQQNIAAYFALPVPRSQSQQQAALNVFDTVWARLQQLCGQPGTGNAGVRCISDRQSGACTWKQTTTSPLLKYPGEPQPGACWNWYNGYRDPIANDPNVVSDSQAAAMAVTSPSGASFLPLLLIGGLVAWGLLA